jgi:hypothetical protein
MGVYDLQVVPFHRFSPSNCAYVADRGRAALELFARWGVQRTMRSRLATAVARLDSVVKVDSYGTTNAALGETLRAINTCLDFFQVGGTFPADPLAEIASELAIALRTSAPGVTPYASPDEYLSQMWVGTALALGNVEPRILPASVRGKRPDYIVDAAGLDVAVEVKRPQSFHSAPDALDRAADQLRGFGRPGVICLDLSQCLGVQRWTETILPVGPLVERLVWKEFKFHAARLDRRVRTYRRSDKFSRVIALLAYARLTHWRQGQPLQPDGGFPVLLQTFERACSGLVVRHAEHFRSIMLAGFERLSGTKPRPA